MTEQDQTPKDQEIQPEVKQEEKIEDPRGPISQSIIP